MITSYYLHTYCRCVYIYIYYIDVCLALHFLEIQSYPYIDMSVVAVIHTSYICRCQPSLIRSCRWCSGAKFGPKWPASSWCRGQGVMGILKMVVFFFVENINQYI